MSEDRRQIERKEDESAYLFPVLCSLFSDTLQYIIGHRTCILPRPVLNYSYAKTRKA
jgi:hypothetical protein